MIKKVYWTTIIAVVLAGVLFAGASWLRHYAEQPLDAETAQAAAVNSVPVVHPEDLPKLYPVGDFSFTDKDGTPFNQDAMKGKIWIGYMFFTSCPAQCPVMTTNLKKVAEPFANDDRVAFAGFSVDPKTDTPEQLTRYAAQYKISNPRWHMLHGSIDDVMALAAKSFKLGSVEDPQFHSDKFVLVDGDGMVRAYFTGIEDAELPKLQDAIKKLLAEKTPQEKAS